jgi:hypothetical protein
VDTVLDMIVSFALTGETSGLRPGMPGAEADRLLGGETGLVSPGEQTAEGSTGFKDGSLEVWVSSEGRVELVGFDADTDGRFYAPAATGQPSNPLPWEMVTARLEARGCTWLPDSTLTFDGQRSIRTKAGVRLVFHAPESFPDAPMQVWLLASAYQHTVGQGGKSLDSCRQAQPVDTAQPTATGNLQHGLSCYG